MSEHRVIVAGAAGFTGALAARLVWGHPRLELAAATARRDAGRRLSDLYPDHPVPVELTVLDLDLAADCEAALVAYPHGAAAPLVAELRGRGVKVVDLSADFRFDDRATYERIYGAHGAPDLLGEAVYGLSELHRGDIAKADLVANPGCYPTAALLALAPLADAGLIADVAISAASGYSGAGRDSGLNLDEVGEDFAPYGIEGHRHGPEISAELGANGSMAFVVHLLPFGQGLLASCFVTLEEPAGAGELRALYDGAYATEPFVEVCDAAPRVRDVRETNLCHVHVSVDEASGRALCFAAIDNLWKGAAGQAIQNLNLMLGLDETEGLA